MLTVPQAYMDFLGMLHKRATSSPAGVPSARCCERHGARSACSRRRIGCPRLTTPYRVSTANPSSPGTPRLRLRHEAGGPDAAAARAIASGSANPHRTSRSPQALSCTGRTTPGGRVRADALPARDPQRRMCQQLACVQRRVAVSPQPPRRSVQPRVVPRHLGVHAREACASVARILRKRQQLVVGGHHPR